MKEIFDDIKNAFWKDERVLEYEQIAKEHEFQFSARIGFAEQPYGLKGMQLFQGEKAKRLNGILKKDIELGASVVRIYDYIYYGGSATRKNTVFEYFIPEIELSKFLIRPKRRSAKLRSLFFKRQSIFPSLSYFNKRYEISEADPDKIEVELNEEFLELLAEQKGIWVEGDNNYLIFYLKNKLIPVGEMMDYYTITLDLLDRFLYGHSNEEFV